MTNILTNEQLLDIWRNGFKRYRDEPWAIQWRQRYAEQVRMAKDAPRDAWMKAAFQESLWDDNPVANIGPGKSVTVTGAFSDTELAADLFNARDSVPEGDVQVRSKWLEQLYNKVLRRVADKKHATRRPKARLIRLLAAVFPEDMTCLMDERRLWQVLRLLGLHRLPGNFVAQHALIRKHLRDVLGATATVEESVDQAILPWYLWETYIKNPDEGGGEQEGNPHPYDEQSYVALRTQNFTYPPSKIRVEAIEVTWSPLTQWVKNTRLRDDFTKPGIFSCLPINQGEQAQPPSRLALNRLVKEDILDRKLADSAIYMGQYHTVMQLGLADALCHAFTGQPILPANPLKPNPPCDWSKASVDPKTRYVFVTHSLGSRLLYDTLLGLLGKNPPGVDQSALATEFPGAESYLRDMLAHTPVIYMMANQLTFLGMANITAQDTTATANRKPAGAPVELQLSETEKGQSGAQGKNEKCEDVICLLAQAKSESVQTQVLKAVPAVSATLDVVAFSDTDDLLTWSIPKEYEHEPLRIVNVYVQNAARFLVVEDPVSAHGGYFKSGAVWDVIRCGAQGTTVNCN